MENEYSRSDRSRKTKREFSHYFSFINNAQVDSTAKLPGELDKTDESLSEENKQPDNTKRIKKKAFYLEIKDKFFGDVISGIISSLILAFITAMVGYFIKVELLSKSIADIEKDIDHISQKIEVSDKSNTNLDKTFSVITTQIQTDIRYIKNFIGLQ